MPGSKDRNETEIQNRQAEMRARVAYSFNGIQPVLCSYVGEDPLFYVDQLTSYELADNAGELLENGPSYCFETLDQKLDNFASACEGFLENTSSDHNQYIQTALNVLEDSRFCAAMLTELKDMEVTIEMVNMSEAAYYLPTTKTIYVNAALAQTDMVLALSREIRKSWHHLKSGALIDPLLFHPDHAVFLNRALQADLAHAMIRTAWELMLDGHREVWSRLEHSAYADLVHGFVREAQRDFRVLNSGVAAANVFENWFLSDRCRATDRTLVDRMLANYKGAEFDNEGFSRLVTARWIESLGQVPMGKNYLAAATAAILGDPMFFEVRDRSTANFLWFVKFESSFSAAEKEAEEAARVDEAVIEREPARIISLESRRPATAAVSMVSSQSAEILSFYDTI